jgi:hypothetical protein
MAVQSRHHGVLSETAPFRARQQRELRAGRRPGTGQGRRRAVVLRSAPMSDVHPRVASALNTQLGAWRAALERGERRVGWKLGLNFPEVEDVIGREPVIGHLTAGTQLRTGASYTPRASRPFARRRRSRSRSAKTSLPTPTEFRRARRSPARRSHSKSWTSADHPMTSKESWRRMRSTAPSSWAPRERSIRAGSRRRRPSRRGSGAASRLSVSNGRCVAASVSQ